jgi:hypothetical protein
MTCLLESTINPNQQSSRSRLLASPLRTGEYIETWFSKTLSMRTQLEEMSYWRRLAAYRKAKELGHFFSEFLGTATAITQATPAPAADMLDAEGLVEDSARLAARFHRCEYSRAGA